MIFAITGTIGAGKSSVANYFKDKGYPVYDSDKMVHAYYEQGEVVYDWLVSRFGTKVLNEDASIDRKALASLVFTQESELEALEGVVFPRVRHDIIALKKKHEGEHIFVEVPLLFEAKMEDLFDKIITVDAFSKIRHQRLKDKGFSKKDILAREKRQYGSLYKKQRSQIIVNNNKDYDHLNKLLKYIERGEL